MTPFRPPKFTTRKTFWAITIPDRVEYIKRDSVTEFINRSAIIKNSLQRTDVNQDGFGIYHTLNVSISQNTLSSLPVQQMKIRVFRTLKPVTGILTALDYCNRLPFWFFVVDSYSFQLVNCEVGQSSRKVKSIFSFDMRTPSVWSVWNYWPLLVRQTLYNKKVLQYDRLFLFVFLQKQEAECLCCFLKLFRWFAKSNFLRRKSTSARSDLRKCEIRCEDPAYRLSESSASRKTSSSSDRWNNNGTVKVLTCVIPRPP